MNIKKFFYICTLTASILVSMFSISTKANAEMVKTTSPSNASKEAIMLSRLGIPYSKEKENYVSYVYDICSKYEVIEHFPELILSIMKAESNFNPNVRSYAGCVGLMQISPYWHADRAKRLGFTNFWDPYSNIYIAVDFINDLYFNYANESIELTVMMYNMDFSSARKLYSSGVISEYAITVFSTQDQLRR